MSIRLVRWVVLIACLGALGLHALGIEREIVELDEFEHVHAAWLVGQGQTPFVDFFEHHTPLFYYLAAPILSRAPASYDTLLLIRWLALLFGGLMTLVAWRWLRRYGPIHGWLAVGLLAANTTLLTLGHTVYLDTFAAPFLVGSAMLIATGRARPARMLASGFCFGLAVLFNIKASMAVFAPMLLMASRGWVSWQESPQQGRAWVKDVAAYLGGGLLSIGFLALILGPEGLAAMWRLVVQMNMGWKARHSGLPTLFGIVWREAFICFAGVAYAGWRVWSLRSRGFLLTGRDVPWLFLASTLAGVFLLPVVWMEYFSTLLPFVALAGAVALGDWFSAWEYEDSGEANGRAYAARARGPASWYVLVLFGAAVIFPFRALFRGDPVAYTQSALILVLFALLWMTARRLGLSAAKGGRLAACLTLALAVPLVRISTTIMRENNAEQRKQMEYVLTRTGPNDAVFDGYTGLGVFRPHAYYYWMIHQEVQAMLPESDKGKRLVEALERRRPVLAIMDDWVATLPPVVQTYLADHYEPTGWPLLKARKQDPVQAGLAAAQK